jgi:hypothetical protein
MKEIRIGTDKDVSFAFEPEIFLYDHKLHLKTLVKMMDQGCLLSLSGSMDKTEPVIEPQTYIDPEAGVFTELSVPDDCKILSVYQHKCWWMRPAFPQAVSTIPKKSQMLLLQYASLNVALLAICSDCYRTDMEGTDAGEYGSAVRIKASSNKIGIREINAPVLAIAWGENPYDCIERAGRMGAEAVGHPEMLRKNKTYPPVFEKLGWCTWNAFYHSVNQSGIKEKLEEFRDKSIPVQWVLIDDGWSDADMDQQLLLGLDADKEKFPQGLKETIAEIKGKYGIEKVGVWHSIMGYWNGLKKDSEAERQLSGFARTLPDHRIVPAPDAEKAFGFYGKWHSHLKSDCGVDFIKVDEQSAISIFNAGMESYGKASGEIQKGLDASAALYFRGALINCMGMGAEDLWHRPEAALTRTSDDFVPEVKHGFREHAIQNAYCSLLAGLFYYGDWDMFFSEHPENTQNAILRAISGGPVYTSDQVGKSEKSEIMPLIFQDGTVIRCDDTGIPTQDCLFQDPVRGGQILKIFNRKGNRYYIAAFNIREDEQEAKVTISTRDIPELSGKRWLVYDPQMDTCEAISDDTDLTTSLKANEARIYELAPMGKTVILGNPAKYIAGGCFEILEKTFERDADPSRSDRSGSRRSQCPVPEETEEGLSIGCLGERGKENLNVAPGVTEGNKEDGCAVKVLEEGELAVWSDESLSVADICGKPKKTTLQGKMVHVENCLQGEILIIKACRTDN